MKNLKFVKKLRRKQLVALVQMVLDTAVSSLMNTMPHAMSLGQRVKAVGENQTPDNMTPYEDGVLRTAINTLSSLATLRGIAVAEDEVTLFTPTGNAIQRLIRTAWSEVFSREIAKLSEHDRAEKEIARLLDGAWPDTKELAKQFVDELKLKPKLGGKKAKFVET